MSSIGLVPIEQDLDPPLNFQNMDQEFLILYSKANMKTKTCMKCPNHLVVCDPDPTDWFCNDDKAVLCKLMKNDKNVQYYTASLGYFKYKPITTSCRPHHLIQETSIPKWCPLCQ